MTEEELSTERLIFAALLRAATEQSTYMIGTLKMQMKVDFKNLTAQMDRFVKSIEKQMEWKPAGLEYFELITDYYHNFNIELRDKLNKKYKEVSAKKDHECIEN